MLIRAIALSLALLIGIGTIIPLATQDAEAGSRKHRKHRHKRHYKKYSKQWWRAYHRRVARRRELQARKRSLRLAQLRLAKQHALENGTSDPTTATTAKGGQTAVLPSGESA